jgi:hypothetical protein
MVPTKLDVPARVALEPICQNTLAALAPFWRMKEVAVAVVRVVAAWKIHWLLASPCPSSVSVLAEMANVPAAEQ